MTLPVSGSISLSDVLTELKIANSSRVAPISLGDSDVIALAGKSSAPVSISDLYGKSSYVAMSGSMPNVSDTAVIDPGANYTAHVAVAISFTGGLAPFTYAWSKVSGDGSVTTANASSTTANFTVIRFSTPGDVLTEVVQCIVTDGKGNTLTKQCTVTLTLD